MRRQRGRFFSFQDDEIINSPRRLETGKRPSVKEAMKTMVTNIKRENERSDDSDHDSYSISARK